MASKRIHTAGDRTPYTYLIGWSHLNKWYYGVKFGQKCHPDDFWVTYFTSSKYVAELIESHGNPDVIDIRRTFIDPMRAAKWENTVLRRLKVINSSKWINQSDAYNHRAVYKPTQKTKDKIREKRKLQVMKPSSEEKKAKIRAKNTGRVRTQEDIDKQKASIAVRTCDRHPRAKLIVIYDDTGTPRFCSHGNFKQTCLDNGLSFAIINKTYLDGDVVQPSKNPNHQTAQIRAKFLGWYAREVDSIPDELCS